MGFFVLALLILLLTAEFSTFVWVAETIGPLDAVTLLLLVSLVGIWLTKRAGLGAVRRIRQVHSEGRVPGRELVDGVLIVLAGALLLFPGFVTGAFGVALLLPPVRAGVRVLLVRRFERSRHLTVIRTARRDGAGGSSEIWDVQSWEERDTSGPGEIGGRR